MLKNFRTFHQAVALYRQCEELRGTGHLKDQLLRAASSVVLNLSEGSAKATVKDRQRFYRIALGSLREVQAVLLLGRIESAKPQADIVAAHLYRLTHPRS